MSDEESLINLDIGKLTKPATILIEKIAEAIGGLFRPYQIRRIAEAEAQAEKVRTLSQIEVTELQQRAMRRFLREEAKKQANIESITQKALPGLQDNSNPGAMDDDWIINFFDKCRLVSSEEMQILWSRLLAGEANSPGRFSRRTVNLLASLEKADAELFASLCCFRCCRRDADDPVGDPYIYDFENRVYNNSGLTFDTLTHLDGIGLISFNTAIGFGIMNLPQRIVMRYFDSSFGLEFKKPKDNRMHIGAAIFSKPGTELAQICHSSPAFGFEEYLVNAWSSMQYKVSVIK